MDKNERLNLIKEILNFEAGDNEKELKKRQPQPPAGDMQESEIWQPGDAHGKRIKREKKQNVKLNGSERRR